MCSSLSFNVQHVMNWSLDFCRSIMEKCSSPVLFSHNDLQEGKDWGWGCVVIKGIIGKHWSLVCVCYICALSNFLFNQLPLYQTSGMPYYTEYVTCRLITFYFVLFFYIFSSICVSMYALALYTPLPATLTPHPWNLKFFTLFMLEGWFRSEHCWKPQSPCLF